MFEIYGNKFDLLFTILKQEISDLTKSNSDFSLLFGMLFHLLN